MNIIKTQNKNNITYNGHRYMQFFLKFETQNLNNMNKDNKNTELNSTDKKLHISDVMCSKKISINDVLSNFEEYCTTKGFNYDDTMYEKVSKYMIWLSSKLD